MLPVRINDKPYEARAGSTIFETCRSVGVYVPSLCHHPDVPALGHCGMCRVKVNGQEYCYSCMTEIEENMVIDTESEDVVLWGQEAMSQFLDMSFPPYSRELEQAFAYLRPSHPIRPRRAERTPSLQFDPSQCLACTRCIAVCADAMGINALDDPGQLLRNSDCTSCGRCTAVCPTSALSESDSSPHFLRALGSGKTMVLIMSVASRLTVGEIFGEPIGLDQTNKVIAAARGLGFRFVFDEGTTQDATIARAADELLRRRQGLSRSQLFLSSCPSFVNMIEKMYPALIDSLLQIEPPAVALARLVKGRLAELKRIKPQNIFVVHLTECVAAKATIIKGQYRGDVDCVLTIREFARLVREFGIDWKTLKESKFDLPWSGSSACALLTPIAGGFTQGIVWTLQQKAYSEFRPIPLEEQLETKIQIGRYQYLFAVCSSPTARSLIMTGDHVKYDCVEVMMCPGGCAFGGGGPRLPAKLASARIDGLQKMQKAAPCRVPIAVEAVRDILSFRAEVARLRPIGGETPGLGKFFALQQVRRPPPRRDTPIVVFGSVRRRAIGYARLISNFLKCVSVAMNQIDMAFLKQMRSPIVFVMETSDDDAIPMNAVNFVREMKSSRESLSGLSFAVLAVGTDGGLFESLESKGARPVLPLTIATRGQKDFVAFIEALANALFLPRPKPGFTTAVETGIVTDAAISNAPSRPIGFDRAEIVEREFLSAEGIIPALHRYLLKLPEGMTYEPSDHATILPENDPEQIEQVLKALKIDPNIVVSIKPPPGDDKNLIPEKVSLRQLFTQYLDLNCAPTRAFVQAFYDAANDEGKRRLSELLDEKNSNAWASFLSDINVCEAIVEFAKFGIPDLNSLISTTPHTLPRIFSIASAPETRRGYLELIVLDVHFGPNLKRHGICTWFLANPNTTSCAVHCMKGIFTYPADRTTPIIIIAVGGGLSPMFSLIGFRMSSKEKLGPALLFFAGKFREAYPLLNKKLNNFFATGVVQGLYVAYSHDPEHKHIQDLLNEHRPKIWEFWEDPRTQIFYSGPARGIVEDIHEIFYDLTVNEGYLAMEEAMAYCHRHVWNIEVYTAVTSG
jgi:sulfite reductase alpha subunit-like flavoprotein/iron only hydrogenase large subunit-like protein/ferredoxin